MNKFGIKHWVTSHPQMNGQVERTNKVLENILTKTMANHHQNWAKNLREQFGHIELHDKIQWGFHHMNLCMGNPLHFWLNSRQKQLGKLLK